jgi:endonuclease/exonuclease/phosphatase family metal-dependent hydrolase
LNALTWNLFHGRSQPPSGRDLSAQFSAKLAGWSWDVALLQEVPPWWPSLLADAAGAQQRHVLTSRNFGRRCRRAVATRWPDLARSNGGGCNVVLARVPIVQHGSVRLRLRPERRVAQLIRLADGLCVVNYHASTSDALARQELRRLHELAREWAAGAPLLFGGDVNLKHPAFDGLVRVAGNHVDHLFTDGRPAAGRGEVLERGALSDHPPVAVTLS